MRLYGFFHIFEHYINSNHLQNQILPPNKGFMNDSCGAAMEMLVYKKQNTIRWKITEPC